VAGEVTAKLAQPGKDRLEPPPVAVAAALLSNPPVPVDRTECPGGETVSVSLAAIYAAPSVSA
jgi:hypothetical protein